MYYRKFICSEKLEDLIFFFVFGCIDLCQLVGPTFVSICIKFPCMSTSFFTKKIVHVQCKWCFVLFSMECCFTRKAIVRGRNVENNIMEARVGVQHFLVHAFKKHYWNLVKHGGGGRHGSSYFVVATKVDQLICFHLGV